MARSRFLRCLRVVLRVAFYVFECLSKYEVQLAVGTTQFVLCPATQCFEDLWIRSQKKGLTCHRLVADFL